MLDMLIQGGRVVTPAGAGDRDVGVTGERIVSVAFQGVEARRDEDTVLGLGAGQRRTHFTQWLAG